MTSLFPSVTRHALHRAVRGACRGAARTATSWPFAVLGLLLVLALAGLQKGGVVNELSAAQNEFGPRKGLPAPEIFGGRDWLNTAKPLTIGDLKGRVVLLDFWTLCCINCIHTLPDLAKLEAKYGHVLVVIGVHSPKFENEKNTESIKKAVLRYQVKHPVVNDADQKIWRRYHVNSWPTLVVIDPDGNYRGYISGEGAHDVLDKVIGQLVKEHKKAGTLKETPLNFDLIKEHDGPLNFPGKILADKDSNRLFIADSTNHRVVITDLAGKKLAIAGDGVEGLKDGSFAEARFSEPQGMTLVGETLYVADRKNHSIRALDLKKQTVKLVAGTGEQNREERTGGGPALKFGLNSPWDLLHHKGLIYIAMAGHHQIWYYDPAKERVQHFSGNGRENIGDGVHHRAMFAQPSGLATDGKNLYVADSEISAIRSVPFDLTGEVSTIVGEGLFEFGDIDGVGDKVRLQHALGIAYRDGKLYVADTYNSKIKLIDPVKRSCTTFLGDPPGWLKPKMFDEPDGLSFAGDKLYIADTNNHRIRVVDMNTKAVTTLELQGVTAPKRAK